MDVTFEDGSGVYCALSNQQPEDCIIDLTGTCAGGGVVQPGHLVNCRFLNSSDFGRCKLIGIS